MITRAKLKKGEGKLKYFDREIGHETQRIKMVDDDACTEEEQVFHKYFYTMENKVD